MRRLTKKTTKGMETLTVGLHVGFAVGGEEGEAVGGGGDL